MPFAVPAVVLLLAASVASVPADAQLFDAAPADANFALSIDVQRLLAHPLARQALDQAQGDSPQLNVWLDRFGGDPLEGLDRLLFVANVDAEAPADAAQEGLLLLTGDFARLDLLAAICAEGCRRSDYRGFEIAAFEAGDKSGEAVLLNPRQAAVGSPRSLRSLIDRRQSGTGLRKTPGPLADWAAQLDRHPIWAAAVGPFAPVGQSMTPAPSDLVEKLTGFGLGLDLGADVELALQVGVAEHEAAQQIHGLAQGLVGMALLAANEQPTEENKRTARLLENLRFELGPDRVSAYFRMPSAELAESLQSGLSSQIAAAARSAPLSQSKNKPEPAPKAQRPERVIRIYGLESEPVIVKTGPNK